MSADIGNLRIGQSPQGIKPPSAAPAVPAVTPAVPALPQTTIPPIVPKPQQSPQPTIVVQNTPPSVIVLPTSSGSGSGRKIIYAIVALVIIGVIIYSLVSLMGGSDTEPTPTPSPSTSALPSVTVAIKNLRTYFGNPTTTINLTGTGSALNDFRNSLIAIQTTPKLATAVAVNSVGSAMSGEAFLRNLVGNPPSTLTSLLGSDWTLLIYGQTEQFDSTGALSGTVTLRPKTVVIFEVTDASGANQSLREWEQTGLASASAGLLEYDISKKIILSFSEGLYRTIPVRYWNFPYADSSIDYALVTASNNKNYLILAASRESMFFTIDQLMQ